MGKGRATERTSVTVREQMNIAHIKYKRLCERLPEGMRIEALNYVLFGHTPQSGFMKSVLANDLSMAAQLCSKGEVLRVWGLWLTGLPMACWGNTSRVEKWMEVGGLDGVYRKQNEHRGATNV